MTVFAACIDWSSINFARQGRSITFGVNMIQQEREGDS